MKLLTSLLIICTIFLTSCGHTYYVVRHAERGTPAPGGNMQANNPPLSDAGEKRAQDLKEILKDKKVAYIFSTNTIRTMSTAEPLRVAAGLTIENYKPIPDSAFIAKLKGLKKNVLVVGHSNTVDDIVNKLTGKQSLPGDLAETEYDNLFVIRYKGKKFSEFRPLKMSEIKAKGW